MFNSNPGVNALRPMPQPSPVRPGASPSDIQRMRDWAMAQAAQPRGGFQPTLNPEAPSPQHPAMGHLLGQMEAQMQPPAPGPTWVASGGPARPAMVGVNGPRAEIPLPLPPPPDKRARLTGRRG